MGELISYVARPVVAKGLNLQATFDSCKISEYLFSDEKRHLVLLENLKLDFDFKRPLVFYPGCGVDIVWFLQVMERVFDSPEVDVLFLDQDYVQGTIETVLDDIGVSFERQGNVLHFYYSGRLFHLTIRQADVFSDWKSVPEYDMYFERAFRLMRDFASEYEKRVVEKLHPGGVLISDSGYKDYGLEEIPVAGEISAYGEMIVGKKR